MALIKCSDCGHEVSDRAQKCPKCGCPVQKKEIVKPPIQSQQIEQPKETKQVPHISDRQQAKKTNVWISLVASLVVMAVIAAVYFSISKNNGKADMAEVDDDIEEVELAEESTSTQTTNINILTDGEYCYKGDWESNKYAAQPCKVEFVKKDNALLNCAYTNLKYDTRIPLNGTIEGTNLHFVGDINGKQLVIDFEISPDGNTINGKGVDYAHSGDEAKLNLKKTDVSLDNASAGLTFRIFTEKVIEDNVVYQNRLLAEEVSKKLMGLGFELIDSKTENRPDYTGEEYHDVTIKTYSKTVGSTTTTVKLEEDYTEIHFPNLNDVEEFKRSIKECGLKETTDGFEDTEEIYWAGTNVSIKGTIVTLIYRWDP